ncbi:MAG: hypothetical protein NT075_12175 [Chloroflexi bacterium]|nr:hypothetical protein [Chloroflexota bacterium]
MSVPTDETNGSPPSFIDRHRRLLIFITLGFGLFFVIFFGLRAYRVIVRWREGTQPIVRPWMTIPRVARQFHIPPEELYQALDVQPERPDRRPLDRLAREKGLMPHILVEQVQKFVDTYPRPPGGPPPPPTPIPTPTPKQAFGKRMGLCYLI